jgi:hypothetical protein
VKPYAPAYPHPINGSHHITHHDGLTKRELFAAMAMQGFAAVPVTSNDGPLTHAHWDAKRAVMYADALLAALDTE